MSISFLYKKKVYRFHIRPPRYAKEIIFPWISIILREITKKIVRNKKKSQSCCVYRNSKFTCYCDHFYYIIIEYFIVITLTYQKKNLTDTCEIKLKSTKKKQSSCLSRYRPDVSCEIVNQTIRFI